MSPPFPEWRERPLPDLGGVRALRNGPRHGPIDNAGAAFSERLVALADFGVAGRNHYAHAQNPPYYAAAPGAVDALFLRESAARKLAEVDRKLRRDGLKLFVYDGWRPRAVQAYFHDVWTPEQLAKRHPHLAGDALIAEVERYWAAPSLSEDKPAPHATGGAVDLTLTWEDGAPLFMGSVFDDATPLAHTDRFEKEPAGEGSFSADEARANRRILYWAMNEAGFANHPDEWWHFSYGDWMWASFNGRAASLYGLAAPPA
ncbi:MAG: M15 family metallopeptidase [Hyphomonadaceae bacterium]